MFIVNQKKVKTVKDRNRFPREAVQCPPLEVFKTLINKGLNTSGLLENSFALELHYDPMTLRFIIYHFIAETICTRVSSFSIVFLP